MECFLSLNCISFSDDEEFTNKNKMSQISASNLLIWIAFKFTQVRHGMSFTYFAVRGTLKVFLPILSFHIPCHQLLDFSPVKIKFSPILPREKFVHSAHYNYGHVLHKHSGDGVIVSLIIV